MADISKLSPDGGTTEYNIKDSTARTNIGDLSELETTDKSDLVSAINEVVQGGGGGGSSTYAGLSDVNLSNLAEGDISVYDATNHEWVNSDALTELIATVGEVNDAFNALFHDDADSGDIEGLFST